MPGFGDTTFIVLLALLLFGPKKLPVLARQLGKLMAEFRRASNEFRTQMEEELRISEQAERQKQIAAIEASAPKAVEPIPEPEHPHLPPPIYDDTPSIESAIDPDPEPSIAPAAVEHPTEPVPIASSGSLNLMPPSTGLPVANTSLNRSAQPELESHTVATDTISPQDGSPNGAHSEAAPEQEARPWMI